MERVTPSLTDISHGDHCCLLFSSEQDQVDVTVPFLALGIERGERSLYVGDPGSIEQMRHGLRRHGVNVPAEVNRGRLVLEINRDFLDDGRFHPERMLDFLQQAYDETLGQGFPALRAAGDVSWQVGPAGTSARSSTTKPCSTCSSSGSGWWGCASIPAIGVPPRCWPAS